MKILAFVDLHGNLTNLKKLEAAAKRENPDVVICAGDFTLFENHIEQILNRISCLGKRILIIHGNHETEAVLRKLCSYYENIHYLHKRMFLIDDYLFVGFGGGGFEAVDSGLEKYSDSIKDRIKDKKVILVTHAPPYKTKLDLLGREHCGNKSITNFIRQNKNIVLLICGHFHETWKAEDRIGNAFVINPGPSGKVIRL